jgi:hypothetical protein
MSLVIWDLGHFKKYIKMELKFDKNRKRVKSCPCCGHDNKGGYVPYIGTDNGYCHYCGSSCFNDNNGTLIDPEKIRYTPPPKTDYLPEYAIEKSFVNHENIDFVKFLLGQLGQQETINIIKKYKLSGSSKNPGAVIFWQIDRDLRIRTGKIMHYNPKTGKRQGTPSWVHNYYDDFSFKQCLFGEHLIKSNGKIAVVESEKAACLMSFYNPAFIWVATGSDTGLNNQKCKVLKGLDVTLFPDQGKYEKWSEKAQEIGLKCNLSIESEKWFNQGEISEGDCIDDYYMNLQKNVVIEKFDPEWNDWLDENPILKKEWNLTYNSYQR